MELKGSSLAWQLMALGSSRDTGAISWTRKILANFQDRRRSKAKDGPGLRAIMDCLIRFIRSKGGDIGQYRFIGAR